MSYIYGTPIVYLAVAYGVKDATGPYYVSP